MELGKREGVEGMGSMDAGDESSRSLSKNGKDSIDQDQFLQNILFTSLVMLSTSKSMSCKETDQLVLICSLLLEKKRKKKKQNG